MSQFSLNVLAKALLPHGMVQLVKQRKQKPARSYLKQARGLMARFSQACPDLPVVEEIVDRSSSDTHGVTPQQIQFWYASNRLSILNPEEVYDVGSHRNWLLGVGAGRRLHTLDVRPSPLQLKNETFHLGRAEELPYPDRSIDCMTSLCSLEHFGLGSYGDAFDPNGDRIALAEMKRVLKPGGHYIFTTLMTGGKTFVVFNTRRVYSLETIHSMLNDELECVDESYFSVRRRTLVERSDLICSMGRYDFDIYLGDWRKR